MRRSVGTAMLWGAFGVTLFGIFLTPVFFYVIRRLVRARSASRPLSRPTAVPGARGGDACSLGLLKRAARNLSRAGLRCLPAARETIIGIE